MRTRRFPFWMVLPLAVLAVFWGLAGCGFPDRRGAADAIADEIRSQPGVTAVDVSYDTSFDGGAHFGLTVTLAPTVTDEQGAAVARAFVDRMLKADFSAFNVAFKLKFSRPGPAEAEDATHSRNQSGLEVKYEPRGDGPSADDVSDSVRWWLDIARSPQIETVYVKLPLDGPYAEVSPPVSVLVPFGGDDAALQAFVGRHPQLQSPTTAWTASVPAAVPYAHPDSYTSVGWPLDARSREAWQQLVELLRPAGQPYPLGSAEARTQIPPRSTTQAPTNVRVRVRLDWDTAGEFENIARRGASLLSGLPTPALFQVSATVLDSRVEISRRRPFDRNLAVTVGGCTPPQPEYTHPAEPLEAELRQQYEHC